MRAIIFKVSLNNGSIFNLRKTPEVLRDNVFRSINKNHEKIVDDHKMSYAMQILNNKLHSLNDNIIFGRIIKFKKSTHTEKWDDNLKDIIIEIEENNIIDKVYFYYEKQSEMLLVEERSGLEADKIKEVFTTIVNYNNMEVEVDINPKLHTKELKERISALSKITWAHFELIPNNPDQRLWRTFEKINESIESTSSIYEFRNKDGLKYTQDIDDAIEDVNEGKSRRYIIGGYIDSRKYDEIRSHDFIKRHYKQVEPSDEGRMKGLWQIMKEILDL